MFHGNKIVCGGHVNIKSSRSPDRRPIARSSESSQPDPLQRPTRPNPNTLLTVMAARSSGSFATRHVPSARALPAASAAAAPRSLSPAVLPFCVLGSPNVCGWVTSVGNSVHGGSRAAKR